MDSSDLTKAVRNHALKDAYAKAYEAGREMLTDGEIERHVQGIREAFTRGAVKTRAENAEVSEELTRSLADTLTGIPPRLRALVLRNALIESFDWENSPEGSEFWQEIYQRLHT